MANINITSLTQNGLKDWLIQRISAVFILAYIAFIVVFLQKHAPVSYIIWQQLCHNIFFQIATLLFVFMLSLHTWIGIWTVLTDYVNILWLRFGIQIVLAIFLLAQFLGCLMIFWRY